MSELIKKFLKRFKRIFPGSEGLEKELIPLKPEEHLVPRTIKKKKKEI